MSSSPLPRRWRCALCALRRVAGQLARWGGRSTRLDRRYALRARLTGSPVSLSPLTSSSSSSSFAAADEAQRASLFIHGASMGEWCGAERFWRALECASSESGQLSLPSSLLLSTQRLSAYNALRNSSFVQKKRVEVKALFYPLDNPDRLVQLWKERNVALVVIYESDLWPGMVEAAERLQIPLWWISARFTPRASRRWRLAPEFLSWMLERCAVIRPATSADAERLSLFISGPLQLSGDFKHFFPSTTLSSNSSSLRLPLAVLSLHLQELSPLLELLKKKGAPDRWILQPRYPQEAAKMERICRRAGWEVVRWPAIPAEREVALSVGWGESGALAESVEAVLVGGSLSPEIGIHNILEPLERGALVLSGPYWYLRSEEIETLAKFDLWVELGRERSCWPPLVRPRSESVESVLAELSSPALSAAQSLLVEMSPLFPHSKKKGV